MSLRDLSPRDVALLAALDAMESAIRDVAATTHPIVPPPTLAPVQQKLNALRRIMETYS